MKIKTKLWVTVGQAARSLRDAFYINGESSKLPCDPVTLQVALTTQKAVSALALFDGVGEEGLGQLAGKRLAALLKDYHKKMEKVPCDGVVGAAAQYFGAAEEKLREMSLEYKREIGSGILMLIVNQGVVSTAAVGGGKIFLYKNARLLEVLGAGARVPAMAQGGAPPMAEPVGMGAEKKWDAYFSSPVPIGADDVYLICSGEVVKTLKPDRISYILSRGLSDEKIVRRIINETMAQGGGGNISAIMVRRSAESLFSPKVLLFALAIVVLISGFVAAFVASLKAGRTLPDIPPPPAEEMPLNDV